jgi:hypothetical protein
MNDEPLPPNLAFVRSRIQELLDAGIEAARVHDHYIGMSSSNADAWNRAQYEFACMPRLVQEGRVGAPFRSGVRSAGARRSTYGFKEFLERREAVAP